MVFAMVLTTTTASLLRSRSSLLRQDTQAVNMTAHKFTKVLLGPFASAEAACDKCFGSFTKDTISPSCTCYAFPDETTPPEARDYVGNLGGCQCNARDMESMAATTCDTI